MTIRGSADSRAEGHPLRRANRRGVGRHVSPVRPLAGPTVRVACGATDGGYRSARTAGSDRDTHCWRDDASADVCARYRPGDDVTTRLMIRLVLNLLALGVPGRDLIGALAIEPEASNTLAPLTTALRLHLGVGAGGRRGAQGTPTPRWVSHAETPCGDAEVGVPCGDAMRRRRTPRPERPRDEIADPPALPRQSHPTSH